MILHQVSNSQGNYNYNAVIYHTIFWPPHFHANYELIYVFDGTVTVIANGTEDTLYQGELILLSPYTVHSLNSRDGNIWIGVFSEDFIVSFSGKHKHTRYSKFKCSPYVEETLKQFLFFEGAPDHFMHISCLYMVCNECVRHATPLLSKINDTFIQDVVSFISENMDQAITLKNVADAMNYEYHYFSSVFHRHFSMNFKSFIHLLRFEKACELLMDKKNSITAVAEQCGFESIRNFNRVFKKISAVTPNEYRQKQR